MIKLSSCIEMMFHEYPFEKRIEAAKNVGFKAFEFWGWNNKDISLLAKESERLNFPAAACVIGTRDEKKSSAWQEGGMLIKDNVSLFAEMVEETIIELEPLKLKTFIVTTGNSLEGVDRKIQEEAIVSCLKKASPILEEAGATLVLEPLNVLVDHMGYYLDRSDQAFDILKEVNSPNVKLLYDVYHQQITEGNLIDTISKNIDLIGHFHIADVPGRHEPGTGEINYENVLKAISDLSYEGFIGCEYSPSEDKTSEESAREIIRIANLY